MKQYLIALDAGHGGKDSGAVGNGYKEKDIALDITLKLNRELKNRGYKTILTRDGDYFVSLNRRTTLANNNNVDLLVSIHLNSYDNPDVNGYETFYHKNSTTGKKLATIIQNKIAPLYKSNRGTKTNNLHITRESKMTAVLLELGFIKNHSDLQSTLKNKDLIAKLIADSIDEYYGRKPIEKDKEEGKKPMYRVRKNWKDTKSQIGAYSNLENAKKLADENSGYFVFDETGSIIYPKKHWADVHFDYLNQNGIEVKQKRFNDPIKRGEAMALLHRLHESLVDGAVKPNEPTEKPKPPVEEKPTEKPKPPVEEKPVEKPKPPKTEEIIEKTSGDYSYVIIPFDKLEMVEIKLPFSYGERWTMRRFQEFFDFDYAINGGFFSFSTGRSINIVYDGSRFESSGDFSKFTMNVMNKNKIEWGEFTRASSSAIGGSPSLIVDGKIKIDHGIGHENERHPRSAIGTTHDSIVLLTVDGRANGKGANLQELAKFMLDLGVENGINLDGGGSSILVKGLDPLNKPLEQRLLHNIIGVRVKK